MRFNPSPYSEGYGLHEIYVEGQDLSGYGVSVPTIDKGALLRDLNSAESTIKQVLPILKKAKTYIMKVKPKKGFGKTWRPRWKIWNAIQKNVLPKLNKAVKSLNSARKNIAKTKSKINSLPV